MSLASVISRLWLPRELRARLHRAGSGTGVVMTYGGEPLP
jgi:hypothetical protein